MAIAMLKRSLAEGKSISIPSLGIVIEPRTPALDTLVDGDVLAAAMGALE